MVAGAARAHGHDWVCSCVGPAVHVLTGMVPFRIPSRDWRSGFSLYPSNCHLPKLQSAQGHGVWALPQKTNATREQMSRWLVAAVRKVTCPQASRTLGGGRGGPEAAMGKSGLLFPSRTQGRRKPEVLHRPAQGHLPGGELLRKDGQREGLGGLCERCLASAMFRGLATLCGRFPATTPPSGGRRRGRSPTPGTPPDGRSAASRAEYFNNLATASRLKGQLSKELQSWGKRKSRMDNKLFSSQR